MGKNIFRWAAVLKAMLVFAACGSGSDSFVRNVAAPNFDQPGSFTDFGQYNGEVDYMDHDFKLAAPDEYPSPGDKWLGEKYLSPSFECKSDRLTVSMNAKTDVPVTEEQLALLDIELDETFSDFALARYKYNGKPESYFGQAGKTVTDIGPIALGVIGTGINVFDLRFIDPTIYGSWIRPQLVTDEYIYYYVTYHSGSSSYPTYGLLRTALTGGLDLDFGGNGFVEISFEMLGLGTGAYSSYPRLLQQSDGKLVVVRGNAMRFHADGSLDVSYGDGGVIQIDREIVGAIVNVFLHQDLLYIDASAKVYPGETSGPGEGVARYTNDGVPDLTWGPEGFVQGLRLLGVSDNWLYVNADSTEDEAGDEWTSVKVARVSSALEPDPNYATDGVLEATFSYAEFDGGLPSTIKFMDYEFDGGLPRTIVFSDDRSVHLVRSTDQIRVLEIDSFGSPTLEYELEIEAYSQIPRNRESLNHWTSTSNNAQAHRHPIISAPDGPLLLLTGPGEKGQSVWQFEDIQDRFLLLRFGSDGIPEQNFAQELKEQLGPVGVEALFISPEGSILVSGGHYGSWDLAPKGSKRDIRATSFVSRLNNQGNLDFSFGVDPPPPEIFRTADQAVDAVEHGGRIILLGNAQSGISEEAEPAWALARYKIDGSRDVSWGTLGVVTTKVGSTGGAKAVTINSDGRIYVAGSADNKLALVRYQTNGTLDSEFGQEGIVKAAIAGRPSAANSVATGEDQQPVVAGYVELGNRRYPALQRYTTAGSLDTGFGYSGTSITKVGKSAEIHDLVIQPNQSIVAVGHVETPTGTDVLVMRFKPSGVLDPSFGNKGKIIEDLGTNTDRAHAVALDRRGRILVTGVRGGSDSDFATLRYTSDGKLDESFGGDGLVTTDFGSPVEQATDIKIDHNQRIVVSGITGKDNDAVFGVVRYKPNGSPDSQFDDDGRVTTDIGTGADHANGLVLLKNQLPIVVGSSIGAEWKQLFPDYDVTIEGYFASAQKLGTKTTAQQAGTTADQLTLDIMYSAGKTKTVFLHVIRDEDTAEFVGAVETTMYVEFDGPPSNRTCAVSMNFASTYKQPWE